MNPRKPNPRTMNPRAVAASLVLAPFVLASPVEVAPLDRYVLIEKDLSVRTLRSLDLSPQGVTGRAAGAPGKAPPLSVSAEKILAVFSLAEPAAPVSGGMLRLIDGQQLPGELAQNREMAAAGKPGEVVLWRSPRVGEVVLPLERVARASLRAVPVSPAGESGADQDVLEMVSGDRVAGFVTGLDAGGVRIETGGQTSTIDPSRVALARLSNPPARVGSPAVWLASGEVLAFDPSTLRPLPGGRVEFTASLSSAQIRAQIASLRAAVWDPAALRPLAGLSLKGQAASGGRRWAQGVIIEDADAAPLGLAGVTLPGPARARWELPRGAWGFACLARLPVEDRLWGDFELVVRAGEAGKEGSELARERMNAQRPCVILALKIPPAPGAQELSLEIDPGERGPIQDKLELRWPVVFATPEDR